MKQLFQLMSSTGFKAGREEWGFCIVPRIHLQITGETIKLWLLMLNSELNISQDSLLLAHQNHSLKIQSIEKNFLLKQS